MLGKKKKNWYILFYNYADKNGIKYGFGSIDAYNYHKKLSSRELNDFVKQIKDQFGYEQLTLTGCQPIRGPR